LAEDVAHLMLGAEGTQYDMYRRAAPPDGKDDIF